MKFQCENCQGVVETDFDDEFVSCGHCHSVCKVPSKLGPSVVIDDFVLIQLLGQGGMGDVYLAYQFSLDRKVALKILKPDISKDEKFIEDFIKESRSVASLNHPKIIQAFKVGIEDEIVFFAMEYVEGQNLLDMLKQDGALEEIRVLEIALDVVDALGYAWDHKKLVHRDIKPENIMIDYEGTAKVMDLGLSCQANDMIDGDGGLIQGTPQYISPEQVLGDEIDIRTDFYCLGVSLYQLLSGRYPFDGDLKEMVRKHIQESPVSLKKLSSHLSSNTIRIVHKLMNKKPRDRYQNAAELEKDIKMAVKNIKNHQSGVRHIQVKTDSQGFVRSNDTKKRRVAKERQKSKTSLYAIGGMILIIITALFIVLKVLSGQENQEAKRSQEGNMLLIKPSSPHDVRQLKKEKSDSQKTEGLIQGLQYEAFNKYMQDKNDILNARNPVYSGVVKNISLSDVPSTGAMFSVRFSGYIKIPSSETYEVTLKADSDSSIFIGGKLIINTTLSTGEEVVKNVTLEKGVHPIVICFSQEEKGKYIKCEFNSVSLPQGPIPDEFLYYRQNEAFKGFKIPEEKGLVKNTENKKHEHLAKPIVWLTFDENQGVGINDFSDNKFNILGQRISKINGAVNRGLLLYEKSQISLPKEIFKKLNGEISIAFWQYGNPNIDHKRNQLLWAGGKNIDHGINIHLPRKNESGDHFVFFQVGKLKASKKVSFEQTKGSWRHWVVTYKASSGILRIYCNGNEWHAVIGEGVGLSGYSIFSIGSNRSLGKYIGALDDFRIYDIKLTGEEVLELYENTRAYPKPKVNFR